MAYSAVKVLLTLTLKIEMVHQEKLPASGGYVLAATHKGWLDVLCMGRLIEPRPIHYMAKKELFEKPLIRALLTRINAFPVNRENPGPSAIKLPVQLLRKDQIVGIFPAGTRGGESQQLKMGAVTIAFKAGVPIVPVRYEGPPKIRLSFFFRKAKVRMVVGDPIVASDSEDKEAKEQRDEMMERLNQFLGS
ncbi:lysophospholipid acyltransferase family protein [Ferviditalea candida]|uniref:1-acyl-sn-glycerol-3-phosphate acyltransferase n=1 Tax=Ferviditalea candida TaxID=3108399 RepID=A0ABU5ZE81_9BACL|nr:lysophospholipid acyltransferase family protein [Paenibacillaceae bacterium T2]